MEASICISYNLTHSSVTYCQYKGKVVDVPSATTGLHTQEYIQEILGLPHEDEDGNEIELTVKSFEVVTEKKDEPLLVVNFDEEDDSIYEDIVDSLDDILDAFCRYYLYDYGEIEVIGLDLEATVKEITRQLERQYLIEDYRAPLEIFFEEYPKYDSTKYYPILGRKFSDIYVDQYTSEMRMVEELFGEVPSPEKFSIHSYIDWKALAEDLISQTDYSVVWSKHPRKVALYVFDLSHLD